MMTASNLLETPRLLLRPLQESDAQALFSIFSDPEVMRYGSSLPWTTIDQAHQRLKREADDVANGRVLSLGMQVKASGELIGTCSLFALDRQNRRAELGYMMATPHWGHGYMHEALVAFINHGFQVLDLHRMEADIDPRNRTSARTLERLGFTKEGFLRERWWVDGQVSDTDLYGLLQPEWAASNHGP